MSEIALFAMAFLMAVCLAEVIEIQMPKPTVLSQIILTAVLTIFFFILPYYFHNYLLK